jgi:DNA-directed RNA polymerase subunit RPC12/RpoP
MSNVQLAYDIIVCPNCKQEVILFDFEKTNNKIKCGICGKKIVLTDVNIIIIKKNFEINEI